MENRPGLVDYPGWKFTVHNKNPKLSGSNSNLLRTDLSQSISLPIYMHLWQQQRPGAAVACDVVHQFIVHDKLWHAPSMDHSGNFTAFRRQR